MPSELIEIANLKREIAYARRIHNAAQAAHLENKTISLYARVIGKPCPIACRQYKDMIFVLKFLEEQLKGVIA